MTMPSKIWAEPDVNPVMGGSGIWAVDPDECGDMSLAYIRADIAEDLARALEAMGNIYESSDPFYVEQHAMDVLARFRAITP